MNKRTLLAVNIPWILLLILNSFFFHLDFRKFLSMLLWYYEFSIIGFLIFPMTSKLLPKLPDQGFCISRVLSIGILFYLNWILTSIGVLQFDAFSLTLCLLLTLFIAWVLKDRSKGYLSLLKENEIYIFRSELLYLLIFCLFLVIQSRHPEIYWGEKPMDYTLLNFNIRNIELPVQDPWFSGKTMHYYYFGYYIFAGMCKMTGVGGELGYALAIVTCAALLSVSLFGLLIYLTKRVALSFWGTLLIILSSNLKSFFSIFMLNKKMDFNFFWSNTRVFNRGAFAEFPSWSLMFADLHPHVMSYAFSMLYLLIVIYCVEHLFRKDFLRESIYGGITLSLSFGLLLAINGWDFIIYTLFSSIYFFTSLRGSKKINFTVYFTLFHCFALLLFLPMLISLKSEKAIEWGYYEESVNTLLSHFSFHGHWWIISSCMVIPLLYTYRKKGKFVDVSNSIAVRFSISALLVALLSEYFFFNDRINTIFKVFTNVYIWGGIISVVSLQLLRVYLKRLKLMGFSLVGIATISMVLVGSYYNFRGITNKRFFKRVDSGLQGGLYLKKIAPQDYKIINWLNENIIGIPTIVEMYSKSFDTRGARFSMHTGLPSYLGWDGHVYLRGIPWEEIEKRKVDIDYIYNAIDPIATIELLMKRNINFIIVGKLERKYYSKIGLEKFSKNSDMYKLLFKKGESALYAVGDYKKFISKK